MDDGARVTVDTEKINALLRELDLRGDEPRKAIRSALRDSANIMKRAAVGALSSITSDSRKRQGVKIAVYKNASGVRIFIYRGFYLTPGRAFVLRWYEEGTKDRYTRKGRKYRGSTTAKPFFERAVNGARHEAESTLESLIIKRINAIAQKNK